MQKQFRISYNGVALSIIADNIRQVAISFENDSLSLDTINSCFPHSLIQTDNNVCVQNDFVATTQPQAISKEIESLTETKPTASIDTQDQPIASTTNPALETARRILWDKVNVIDARQVLKFCRQAKSRKEITDYLGIAINPTHYESMSLYFNDLAQIRQVLIWELVRAGYLKMTNTNFPTELIAKRHPFQKFKSTKDGLDVLRELNDLKRQGKLNNQAMIESK